MVYRDNWRGGSGAGRSTFQSWEAALSPSYTYHKQIRGRVAVFVKYGFMTEAEGRRIFSLANLAFDRSMIDYYIQQGRTGTGRSSYGSGGWW